MATLAAPKAVSPLIKFCRWGALIAGFGYGTFRYNQLARREVGIQEHENKIKAQRDARLAKEAEAKMQAEMNALGREAGVLK